MSQPKVSIIIPVYNTEKYLSRCIDSILHQSFSDFEVLLINDGSTDSSGDLCDKFEKTDKRIRVFHKVNGGVSSARNIGLQYAIGEWILFCDSDDELENDCFHKLFNFSDKRVELVVSGYEIITDGKQDCISSFPAFLCTPLQYLKYLFEPMDGRYQGYICSKLYKNEIIKNNSLKFAEEIYYNEDRLFAFEYVCKIRGLIYYISESTYRYYCGSEGAIGQINKRYKKFRTHLDSYVAMYSLAVPLKDISLNKLIKLNAFNSFFINSRLTKKYDSHPYTEIRRLYNKVKIIITLKEFILYISQEVLKSVMYKVKRLLIKA